MSDRSTDRSVDQTRRHPYHDFDPDFVRDRALEIRARPRRGHWRLWLKLGLLAFGVTLCILPVVRGEDGPPQGAPPPAVTGTPLETIAPSTQPQTPPRPKSPSPQPTGPSAKPSPTAAVTATVNTPAPPPPVQGPVLLGPSGDSGLEDIVQRYCDQHTAGTADSRDDGRWQCRRLLTASIVDMDVACRDAYGSGAYARTSEEDEPYAWRCYR